ncbi:hypothetical protein [Streptomyces zhihengii]
MTPRKRLTQKKAQETVDGARLVKAPSWSEDRCWHVVGEDGAVLVVVSPSYGGAGRSGRDGWRQHLAALGPSGSRERHATRQAAAVRGLVTWVRWVTSRD